MKSPNATLEISKHLFNKTWKDAAGYSSKKRFCFADSDFLRHLFDLVAKKWDFGEIVRDQLRQSVKMSHSWLKPIKLVQLAARVACRDHLDLMDSIR